MASGGTGRKKAVEETFDYTCSVCSKKKRVSEAVKHCQECQKYLCTFCLEQHNEYQEDHTLVEPSDVSGCKSVVMPTEMCREHSNELLKLWCKQHDEIICSSCVVKNHIYCADVKIIHEEINNLLKEPELQETKAGLKSTTEQLLALKKAQIKKEEELLNGKKKYIGMIEKQQRKMIELVESMGKSAIDEINAWYDENSKKVKETEDSREKLENVTTACMQQLDSSSENKSQVFVSMKKGQKLIKTTKAFVTESKVEMNQSKKFEINHDIEKSLVSLKSLGSFKTRSHTYTVTNLRKVNIKIPRDRKLCDITDTCILPDGFILLADFNNKRLKRLDSSTYKVKDHVLLPKCPWSVCCVGQNEVAVSLGNSKNIQFVTTGKEMALKNSIELEHYCAGLCFSDGELFISDIDKNVYVYNLSGSLLRTINQTPTGESLFSKSRHLAVYRDIVYVSDNEFGLVQVDKCGKEMCRYRGSQIEGGSGVASDGQGGAFLCGRKTLNLVHIGNDGEEKVVVPNEEGGLLLEPRSVNFDPSQNKLILSLWIHNFIYEYDIV